MYNCRTTMVLCELQYVERCSEFVPVSFSFDDAVICAGTTKGAVRMWAIQKMEDGMPPQFTYFMKCSLRGRHELELSISLCSM